MKRRQELSPAGAIIRHWRNLRGNSQLQLSSLTGISARHLSFLETGRARATPETLERIGSALGMSARHRHALLEASGFLGQHDPPPLHTAAMDSVREGLRMLMRRFEPYGALVHDRYGNVLMASSGLLRAMSFFADLDACWGHGWPSATRLLFHPLGLCRHITNWREVALVYLQRAHAELYSRNEVDPAMDELFAALCASPAVKPEWLEDIVGFDRPGFLPILLERDGLRAHVYNLVTTFGTPQDPTLRSLRVEYFLPVTPADHVNMLHLVDTIQEPTGPWRRHVVEVLERDS
jgi:transcriptional regulator with XRE-family HTH domain